jgi:lipoprotein-releasing system permease protein
MFKRSALSRKIALRLAARGSTASWSRPVVQIATTGVAVGMALIVIATSVVHGFQEEVKELVVGFGSDIQVLHADYEDQKIIRSQRVEAELAALEGVESVHPFYTMPGILESSAGVKGVMLKGVNDETSSQLLNRFLKEGSATLGSTDAILSSEQARKLDISIGDRFTLYLVGGPTGVRGRTMTLAGVYQTGLLEYDEEFMFLPAALIQQTAGWGMDLQLLADSLGVEARAFGSRKSPVVRWHRLTTNGWETRPWTQSFVAQERLEGADWLVTAETGSNEDRLHPDSVRLFQNETGTWEWEHWGGGWAAAASGLEVFIKSGADLWEVEQRVYQSIPIGLRTQTVLQQSPEMFTWLGMLDLNVEIIIGLMVLISMINMTSALLILILERRPMVGMLKALGMSDSQVMRVFFWQAVRILGRGFLWGNFTGMVLVGIQSVTGWVTLNPEAYYLDVVPVRIDFAFLGGVELLAFGMCALMMWLPSLASTRIHPAEALRINR